jgi:hypothetical protein
MMPPSDTPRDLADRLIRQSLRQPENLRDFLRQVVPDLADGFVFESLQLLDREFFLEDWRRREADLPFEIPYRTSEGEQMALVYLLIEHQSDTDPLMPFRMLSTTVSYWDRQWQAWANSPRPRSRLQLAPVLPIVLYTGATPWGSNRSLAELLAPPLAFHRFAPHWEPIFWNLADQTPEALLSSGAAWLQLLAVMRVEREESEDFLSVFAPAMRRLAALQDAETVRWRDLLEMVLRYALWRRPDAERTTIREVASEAHPARQEEVRTMGQTIAEALIEEGFVKGIAKGRAEGELHANREILHRLLIRKFPELPETVLQQIESCADLQRLKAAIDRVLEVKSLDEFNL